MAAFVPTETTLRINSSSNDLISDRQTHYPVLNSQLSHESSSQSNQEFRNSREIASEKDKRQTNYQGFFDKSHRLVKAKRLSTSLPDLNAPQDHTTKLPSLHQSKPKDSQKKLPKSQGNFKPYLDHSNSSSKPSHPYRHLVFSPKIRDSLFAKYISQVYRGVEYSVKVKGPSKELVEKKKVFLTENPVHKKTLVLDLDETIIRLYGKEGTYSMDSKLLEKNLDQRIPILVRPFAKEFLTKMAQHYEIVVFTAACEGYARSVVNALDMDHQLISHVFDRSHCLRTKNGLYIKDLRLLGNREIKNIVIVDNTVASFCFQLANGIPILEWTGDTEDRELEYISEYLVELANCENIPEYNTKRLKLVKIIEHQLEELLNQ